MKSWAWIVIALVGFAGMLSSSAWRERSDHPEPWSSGLLIMEGGEAPANVADSAAIPVRLRLLSSSDVAEMLLFGTGDLGAGKALATKAQVRVKLIELPFSKAGLSATELQSGRLPEPGRNEVVAGDQTERGDTVNVGGHELKVVGVLKPSLALFANSYLIPPDASAGRLFPTVVPTVHRAWLLDVSAEKLHDAGVRKPLEQIFPTDNFVWLTAPERLEPLRFNLYLAGLAIFLLGGSGFSISRFRLLADKVTSPFHSAPLLELKARPRLLWFVHLFYFALVIAGALLSFAAPEAQVVLLGKLRGALSANSGLLSILGQPYLARSHRLAVAVTFAFSYLLGSLAWITLPSIVLPCVGVLLAGIRAVALGLLLAPITQAMAFAMLPHSLALLLEGEGVILATFFGLLVPIHVIRRSLGGNVFTRFGRALSLNFKAQAWIALLLALAAIYEATWWCYGTAQLGAR